MSPLLPLLACLAWGGAPVRDPDNPVTVFLVTMSPGEQASTVFGHTVLRIRDDGAAEDQAWSWGVARFHPALLPWYFVAGRMPFSTEVRRWPEIAEAYARQGRRVEVQQLDLTEGEARQLLERVRVDARPDHRDYAYHTFYDNCATRPRDHLDAVLDGRVKAATTRVSRPSYRTLVRRATASQPVIGGALDIVLGRPAEVELTRWEAMFLPSELQAGVAEVWLPGPAGEEVPLVSRTWVQSPGGGVGRSGSGRPGLAPTAVGLGVGGVLVGSARIHGWLFRVLGTGWSLLAGVAGLILLGAWFTDHPTWRWNENLLAFGPWSVVLGVLLLTRPESRWTRRVAVATVAVAAAEALAGLVAPGSQANAAWTTLALPVHLAIAWVVWSTAWPRSGDRPPVRGTGSVP